MSAGTLIATCIHLLTPNLGQLPPPICEPHQLLLIDPLERCWCEDEKGLPAASFGTPGTGGPGGPVLPGDPPIDPEPETGVGNPGNDKDVGGAGESPGGDKGDGVKGSSQ